MNKVCYFYIVVFFLVVSRSCLKIVFLNTPTFSLFTIFYISEKCLTQMIEIVFSVAVKPFFEWENIIFFHNKCLSDLSCNFFAFKWPIHMSI